MVATTLSCRAASLLISALALPNLAAAAIWVSVDSTGSAQTFTPTPTLVDGVRTTIDAEPYSLTATVYTLTETDGSLTTSTGLPPPPRATDESGGQGYFRVCLGNANSAISPFCTPRNGVSLHVDEPYYITWDTHAFAGNSNGHILGYSVNSQGSFTASGDPVFNLTTAMANGYYAWTPSEADLDSKQNQTIQLVISSDDHDSTGAQITLLPARENPEDDDDDDDNGGGGGGPNLLAIILPIVFVVVGIAAAVFAFLFIRRRRRGAATGSNAAKRVSSGLSSYGGAGGAANQKNDVDIELTVSPTSPRTPGQNVFQEEIARQNRERE